VPRNPKDVLTCAKLVQLRYIVLSTLQTRLMDRRSKRKEPQEQNSLYIVVPTNPKVVLTCAKLAQFRYAILYY